MNDTFAPTLCIIVFILVIALTMTKKDLVADARCWQCHKLATVVIKTNDSFLTMCHEHARQYFDGKVAVECPNCDCRFEAKPHVVIE